MPMRIVALRGIKPLSPVSYSYSSSSFPHAQSLPILLQARMLCVHLSCRCTIVPTGSPRPHFSRRIFFLLPDLLLPLIFSNNKNNTLHPTLCQKRLQWQNPLHPARDIGEPCGFKGTDVHHDNSIRLESESQRRRSELKFLRDVGLESMISNSDLNTRTTRG